MRLIIHNLATLFTGIAGLVGGLIWGSYTNWEFEPLILSSISLLEIIAYFSIPKESDINKMGEIRNKSKVENKQNVKITVNNITSSNRGKSSKLGENKNAIIETKKDKIGILFIDDDKNFNVVRILKDSGWKKTKAVVDIKSLDVKQVITSEIIFVDINGVGKILNLEYEGLDLALMLKQKYPEKKIIIYSANKNSNSFHEAWTIADARLEKNALIYQFQNLVENYSLEYYN